ncbi:Cytochrome c7 c [uncultured archaeon]|nr:Cytochrome c7 c [uncultured archaeon]
MLEEKRKKFTGRLNNSGIVFTFLLVTVLLLSNVASAAISQYALRCDSGTTIGIQSPTQETTDFVCGSLGVPIETGLLLDLSTGTSTQIQTTNTGTGTWDYGHFVNNTAFLTDVNVTGYSGYISMNRASSTTATGKLEIGYYDPNGATHNFVGLFNSTTATGSSTKTSYSISFNNQYGIIPSGMKLAVRVWMTASSSNARPSFYSFSTASNSNSSVLIDITPVGGAAATYNISGYIINKSAGQPLTLAIVQTNTSLSTTTNAQGYYVFTGLSNGTYLINASQTGYAVNSTTATISGANKTNVNISLTPVPAYLLSGYVTNQSSGAAISGATVTTNASQTTTTDGTGFYSFGEGNGTYLITASKAGYNGNSITRTVNGAAVPNSNITLASQPPIGGRILVATNRYVVLDDPNTGSFAGTGFINPTNNWGTNNFNGVETTITMWAMVLDQNGMPVSNTNVNFTLKNPNNAVDYTFVKSTDSNGLVNLTSDLNAKNYYGKWQVVANATSLGLSDSTSFIYNWWGCGGGAGCGGHGSETVASGAPINSPYTTGHDAVVGAKSDHQQANICMYCHLSYNGQGSTPSMNTSDVHRNLTCDNPSCHGSISQHTTNMVIGSCNNCHNRTEITKKTTLNGILSNYSTTSDYHDANSTIPCIICHGPMHNITKPDESQRFIKNNITEDSQCKTCHQNYNQHNNSVNCTLCHSEDVHVIQVFSKTAGYVNHGSPNQGDCTNCHQNASYFNALKSQTDAGNYTGPNPPQIPTPLNHSTDRAGVKWGTYWTTPYGACLYCHGDNKHSATMLGNIAVPVGTDPIGGAIGAGTLCSSCHNPNDSNYAATMAILNPDPVANQPGSITWNMSGTDHSSYGVTDTDCKTCHGGALSTSPDMIEFPHNVDTGKGGSDCIGCHTTQQGIYPAIDLASFTKHMNVNTSDGSNTLTNNDCKTCHYDISNMYSPGFNVLTKTCTDCHSQGAPGPIISNHRQNGVNISTGVFCSNCHNNSINKYVFSMNASVGHYETNTSLIDTTDCTYCHKNPVNASKWGGATDPANSLVFPHSISSTPKQDCYACHSDISTTDFHNKTLAKPALSTVNCLDCHATTRTMAPKEIDAGVFAAGVHKNRVCNDCHSNATDTNMNIYSFTSDPAKTCTYCHTGSGNFNAPLIAEHNQVGQQVITVNATCNTCHDNTGMYLPNAGTNGSTSAITHYLKDVTNRSTNPYQHFGPINTSNCIDCHNGPNTTNPIWGTPVNISTSTKRQHTETQTSQCDLCHNDGRVGSLGTVDFHNASVQPALGAGCIACHSSPGTRYYVNISLFASNANVSTADGTNVVTDADCKTCHYGAANGTMSMTLGAANQNNTYFCNDCHTSAGTGPVKPTDPALIKDGLSHGKTDCKWCHIAGDLQPRPLTDNLRYHPGGPKGTAAGQTCVSCHYNANLPDLPFHAPGEKHSTVLPGDPSGSGCEMCHNNADNHAVSLLTGTPPQVSGLSVPASVSSGTPAPVQATVSHDMLQIAAAQYQVINSSGIVIDWTNMNPQDGNFDYPVETVNASIDTSNLKGTYTVNVKGMASAPRTDPSKPYYPLNGQWSSTSSTTLTVNEARGYVNGTVKDSLGNAIAGALVATNTSSSAITDGSGFYSLSLVSGTYQLTVSKEPAYVPNSATVTVTAFTTVTQNITLALKPTGTISGTVTAR